MVCQLHRDALATDSLHEMPYIASYMYHVITAGLMLCLAASRELVTSPQLRAVRPALIRRVTNDIHARPEHPFTVTDLAALGNVSVRTLQEGFRRYMGVTPMQYLRQVRLARAHDLLRRGTDGTVTVAAVAHQCGFTHLGRFSQAYRNAYGRSPSQTLRDTLTSGPSSL